MKTEDIIFSLQKFWQENAPADVLTAFPGAEIDVSTQTKWIEFWVSQIHDLPKRIQSPTSFMFLLDIHFFSREANKRAVSSLLDEARIAFQETSIVVNSVASPTTRTGQLRFREPTIRDFTRNERLNSQSGLQHFVMSVQATAIEKVN